MNTKTEPAKQIRRLMGERKWTFRDLSRHTGISYRRLLRCVLHEESALSLEDAIVIADAFAIDLPALTREMAA